MSAHPSGTGVGWRPEIASVLGGTAGLGFCEVIAESLVPAGTSLRHGDVPGRRCGRWPHAVRR